MSKITLAQGSGGIQTENLIKNVFFKHFNNPILAENSDSAVLENANRKFAYTTDSFIIEPYFFPGGDIGKLAICGTVNDLVAAGARPQYLTAGFIIEEGFDAYILEKIVISMSETAAESDVLIVAGDTKVLPKTHEIPQIYINTSGVGYIENSPNKFKSISGQKIIVTGNLGDHEAAVMSSRMGIENNIKSDVAPLTDLVKYGINVEIMRDITRGGLATVLHELSTQHNFGCLIYEKQIPVAENVKGFCSILGLDPLYMANEGKMLIIAAEDEYKKIKNCKYCKNAVIIGEINSTKDIILQTEFGGKRLIQPLFGESLPRIC